MANPPGNHQEPAHASSSAFNGNGSLAPETSGTASAMKHNPGISMEWTAEEQSMLDHGLSEFASESSIIRYAKIAMQLKDKTVRDVALRVRWMTKKENSRRRKEEHNLSRKSKEKKERANDPSVKSSQFAARPIVLPHALPMVPMDNDDGIPYKAIGGLTGEMLEQNAQAFNQISANLAAFQIQENVNLFCQTRDNILKIMNELSDQPEIMKQMPALPVKVNEELANTILPRTTLLAYRDPNHLLRLRIKHIQLICGPTFYSNFVSLSLIHLIKILEPVHEAGLKNKLVARALPMTGLGL